jgi:hypothetical protein
MHVRRRCTHRPAQSSEGEKVRSFRHSITSSVKSSAEISVLSLAPRNNLAILSVASILLNVQFFASGRKDALIFAKCRLDLDQEARVSSHEWPSCRATPIDCKLNRQRGSSTAAIISPPALPPAEILIEIRTCACRSVNRPYETKASEHADRTSFASSELAPRGTTTLKEIVNAIWSICMRLRPQLPHSVNCLRRTAGGSERPGARPGWRNFVFRGRRETTRVEVGSAEAFLPCFRYRSHRGKADGQLNGAE